MTSSSIQTRIALFVTGLREPYVDISGGRREISPDTYLFSLKEHLHAMGFADIVYMPEQFKIIKAAIKGDFSNIARDLNEHLLNSAEGKRIHECEFWVMVGHSAGGLAIYKWIEEYGAEFPSPPNAIYVFDSPHQLVRVPGPFVPAMLREDEVSRLRVGDGVLPCRLVDMTALALRLSGMKTKMIRFCSGDRIFTEEERLIPQAHLQAGTLEQFSMSGSGHNEICACDSALRLLIRDARLTL